MNRKQLYDQYAIDNPPPAKPANIGWVRYALAASVLCALALSADRTYTFIAGANPNPMNILRGVLAVGTVELFIIGGGGFIAKRYNSKRFVQTLQYVGGALLILVTIGIIAGTNVHGTLDAFGRVIGVDSDFILAVLFGLSAPFLGFFGVKFLVSDRKTDDRAHEKRMQEWRTARKAYADAELVLSDAKREAPKRPGPKVKRNPNAKQALIELIRRNEIANWETLSNAKLSQAASALGVQVGKETARKAKEELLNGH